MVRLQAWFAVTVAAVAGLPFMMSAIEVAPPKILAWFPAFIVLASATFAMFAVFYQRIRPVAPGNIGQYRSAVAKRAAYALIPAYFGVALYVLTGLWATTLLGTVFAMPGLFFSIPSQDDFIRHQEIWNERLPMPVKAVWGTADRDAIPPWEDADGGHGHGIGHHGLH